MSTLSALDRGDVIKKMSSEVYDLIIIGGGITGAGIALDAASRGLKVALVEKSDFASGTSSKSTKLIHGGLRYLKQFEIALVREVGKERATVHRLAPHLVKAEKMLLPLIKDGTYGKIMTSLGLMVYDVLAGVEREDQRVMLSKKEALSHEPLLDEGVLEGGGLYAEYRTDDARLTLEVLKTATTYNADVLNYAEATDFLYTDGMVSGITWKDHLTGTEGEIKSKYVISAAGPWVDNIRKKNQSFQGKRLHPTKGVHIVIPREKFPVQQSIYFDVPDGRMLFAIPRERVTYLGTTDTDYNGDLNDVRTDKVDVEYLLDGANGAFPSVDLTINDVESSWAGLRPLIEEEGKSASELSRKDEIFESETGLLSIAGGKLTGYRKMAERIIDKLAKRIDRDSDKDLPDCNTDKIPLTGGPFKDADEVFKYEQEVRERIVKLGLAEFYAVYLVGNYGKQTEEVLKIMDSLQNDDIEVKLALAELEFTIRHESVQSVMDFFERRTGRLYFNIKSIEKLKQPVLDKMTNVFNWSDERIESENYYLNKGLEIASQFK
ncbi:MAG: glycerol-3-phosphate dehydrogenase/oxidase [Bacteroidota bacterium]